MFRLINYTIREQLNQSINCPGDTFAFSTPINHPGFPRLWMGLLVVTNSTSSMICVQFGEQFKLINVNNNDTYFMIHLDHNNSYINKHRHSKNAVPKLRFRGYDLHIHFTLTGHCIRYTRFIKCNCLLMQIICRRGLEQVGASKLLQHWSSLHLNL